MVGRSFTEQPLGKRSSLFDRAIEEREGQERKGKEVMKEGKLERHLQ
jgi:hypothetical protein